MTVSSHRFLEPRRAGAAASAAAVGLGCAYILLAGGPVQLAAVNLAALLLGLTVLTALSRAAPAKRWREPAILALAALLLGTSLFGASVEGASRWFVAGPFFVQTSLLVLPAMLVGFARSRGMLGAAAMAVAALALALQQDRAMAGALTAGLAMLALVRFERNTAVALTAAVIGFLITLMRPDTLPAVPFVDNVLLTAFGVHPLAGLAVWTGSAVLLVPAFAALRRGGGDRAPALVFGAVWLAIITAALMGNYPTPLVGYGASAIIGYLLGLAAMPIPDRPRAGAKPANADAGDEAGPGASMRLRRLALTAALAAGGSIFAAPASASDCTRPHVEKVEIPNTVWEPGPDGEQIALWPDDLSIPPPDYAENPEMIGSGSPLIAGRTWNWATYVARPTMTIYRPRGENNGAAILVLPGGGYAAVAMDLEGTEVCDWITRLGVTCVVLKYRAPQVWERAENGVQLPPGRLLALEDAQRAMGLLRTRAVRYGIDPAKIGVIGFSAGAHLAAVISNAEARAYGRVDAADDRSSRPDFAIVMYPGRFLTEREPGANLALAPWMHVSTGAPPTLLIHAMNDAMNDVRHSIAYGLALSDVGVPVDMRFFSEGCHAFGLRPTDEPITTQWPDDAARWLRSIGML